MFAKKENISSFVEEREEEVTLCLKLLLTELLENVRKEKLAKVSPGVNASSYMEFLKGNMFDPNMFHLLTVSPNQNRQIS